MSETNKYESYPPLFRPGSLNSSNASSGYGGEESNKIPDPFPVTDFQNIDPLPVVDFQNIDGENLGYACRDWGMFRLVNHGIPASFLNKFDDLVKKMFGLSFDSKEDIFKAAPIAYFWGTPGLTPSGTVAFQSLQQPGNINWLEGFHIIFSQLSKTTHHYQDDMLESFRNMLEEYGNYHVKIVTKLFEAMALNLNLDSTKTKSYLSADTGHIRAYRYPCNFHIADPDHKAWGIHSHTDSTALTILHQDDVPGLQLLSKDDQWIDVQPLPNSLIINLGDMIQAMSDDKYRAPKHRVKVHKAKERISIGYFVFPYDDTVIESSKYKAFTYSDFRAQVQQDLKTVGYKIGLPKFKLDEDF